MAAIDDVYRRFSEMYADGEPIRRPEALSAAIAAGGLSPEDIDDAWLRALPEDWVYGGSEEPFADPQTNREYRRLLARV